MAFMNRYGFVLLVPLLLDGCGSSTPYQVVNRSYGPSFVGLDVEVSVGATDTKIEA